MSRKEKGGKRGEKSSPLTVITVCAQVKVKKPLLCLSHVKKYQGYGKGIYIKAEGENRTY